MRNGSIMSADVHSDLSRDARARTSAHVVRTIFLTPRTHSWLTPALLITTLWFISITTPNSTRPHLDQREPDRANRNCPTLRRRRGYVDRLTI